MSIDQSKTSILNIVNSLEWYHTIDLGNGIVTNGIYDHRPYLHHYQIPQELSGKTVLDIGAASGFFSFEFEKRGAKVTATEIPEWFGHDFGPNYDADKTPQTGRTYLHQPFEVAKQALGSNVDRKIINIYNISPTTVGVFDLVFCGSLLLHLTDPIKAFWNIASVTKEKAIVSTVILPEETQRPIAAMHGYIRGDVWWIPTRMTFELMAVVAGFKGIEWVSEFQLNARGKDTGPYHGVLHAYKTSKNWTSSTQHRDEIIQQIQERPVKSIQPETLRRELESIKIQVQKLKKDNIQKEHLIEDIQYQLSDILNSRSWRVLRKMQNLRLRLIPHGSPQEGIFLKILRIFDK